jgi:hypothetical protein
MESDGGKPVSFGSAPGTTFLEDPLPDAPSSHAFFLPTPARQSGFSVNFGPLLIDKQVNFHDIQSY